MPFHQMMSEHTGVDIEQIVIEAEAPLDARALETAWQKAPTK